VEENRGIENVGATVMMFNANSHPLRGENSSTTFPGANSFL
jgi:hypothetical protein